MRQETGSNPHSTNKKVSIQVKLGGLSFSANQGLIAHDADVVEFVIDTPRVTLVPREEISLDSAKSLLRIIGKPCRANECAICSEPQSDIVAVMAIDCATYATITEQWGSRALLSSPLLDMRHSEEHCLTVDISDKVCYMRLFENGLQRAEAYDVSTSEDILYYVSEWVGNSNIPIYIKSRAESAKLLSRYYKQVVCE